MSEGPEWVYLAKDSRGGWSTFAAHEDDRTKYVRADLHTTAIREAVEAERERCARIARIHPAGPYDTRAEADAAVTHADRISDVIRTPDSEEQR